MAGFKITLMASLDFDVDALKRRIGAALYEFAETKVMAVAYERVPIRLGTLSVSGYVEPPVEQDNVITVTMGFGGPAAGYALYVHEALEGPHPINPNWSWAKAAARGEEIHWTRPGSGPKYLEGPLREAENDFAPAIAAAIRG